MQKLADVSTGVHGFVSFVLGSCVTGIFYSTPI